MNWQPISSAPKDGAVILATLPASDVPHSVRFHTSDRTWRIAWDGYLLGTHDQPTAWMPLPPSADAPVETEGGVDAKAHCRYSGATLLDYIEANSLSLEPVEDRAPGGDDADMHYEVYEFHMAKPHKRSIGWGKTAREAIASAMEAKREEGS